MDKFKRFFIFYDWVPPRCRFRLFGSFEWSSYSGVWTAVGSIFKFCRSTSPRNNTYKTPLKKYFCINSWMEYMNFLSVCSDKRWLVGSYSLYSLFMNFCFLKNIIRTSILISANKICKNLLHVVPINDFYYRLFVFESSKECVPHGRNIKTKDHWTRRIGFKK